jgi:predicted nucleic acid-binding protein
VAKGGKVFIDTNVLVYSVDRHDPVKQRVAREALRQIERDRCGVISTQVAQEFYVAATRKLGVEPLVAKEMVHALRRLDVVLVDMDLVGEAVDCSILNRLSFWDALIVVAAEKAGCAEVWTEDLNDGQAIRGVRLHNPFRAEG